MYGCTHGLMRRKGWKGGTQLSTDSQQHGTWRTQETNPVDETLAFWSQYLYGINMGYNEISTSRGIPRIHSLYDFRLVGNSECVFFAGMSR